MAFVIYDALQDLYFTNTEVDKKSTHVLVKFSQKEEASSKFETEDLAAKALALLKTQHQDEMLNCKVVDLDA